MKSPIPPISIKGHCSVIYGNTLYVYSPNGFLSLPLHKGGKWSKLKNGVSVDGAACVKQANGDSKDAALWVVGGTPTGSDPDYTGLQKFSFQSKSWETIEPISTVTKNRNGHAAVFLPGTSEILVYAGNQQDASIPNSETYTISTIPPYAVSSYSSHNPTVVQPQLLQWEDNSAITIGGSDSNQGVYLFQSGGSNPWQQIYPNLPAPIKPSTQQQAALIHGSDGSKILELYDCSVSPTNVSQYVLQSQHGKAAHVGDVPGSSSSKKRKRGITLQKWPRYNAKNAPKPTRSDFSIAQSENGLVAISGGVKNRRQSIELFNVKTNSWINTSSFFGPSAHQKPLTGHHPSGTHNHPHNTPISAPSPSSTPNSNEDHSHTTLILGATLGSILGFIALLIILLLFLRHRRQKKRQLQQEQREREEKHRLSFADRGDPFMKEIDAIGYHPHEPMIHVTPAPGQPGHQRSDTRGSENSTTYLVPKKKGDARMNDAMEMEPIGEGGGGLTVPGQAAKKNSLTVPGAKRNRTSGWSRYFSGADLLSARTSQAKSPRASAAADSDALPKTDISDSNTRQSETADSAVWSKRDTTDTESLHDCTSHGPTQLPPLDMGQQFGGGVDADDKNNRQSIQRTRTVSSTHSSAPPSMTSDTIYSQDPIDEQTTWTPVTRSDYASPGVRNTATSSIYGGSLEGGEPGPLYQSGPSISVPNGSSANMVSGASIIRTISEEDENPQPRGAKPTIMQVTPAPAGKGGQPIVQDDMGWLNLGRSR